MQYAPEDVDVKHLMPGIEARPGRALRADAGIVQKHGYLEQSARACEVTDT